jgi:putative molybdenum carrier protein
MVSRALRFPSTNCRSACTLLKRKSARLRCEIFRNCLAPKKKSLTNKLLKVISGGQTGVDRGALDAALALQVECGGWCPEGRLAEDGTIPKRYPMMELANAGYAERTARNVADSEGTLIISNGVPLGGTRETVDRCIEMRKPHLIIDCGRRSVQETIEVAIEFVTNLSFQVARTTPVRLGPRNLSSVRKSPGELGDPSRSLGMTTVLNVAGPRASQWPEGHKTAQRIVSGILRRLVDRTAPLNTVRDSPRGDP